MAEYILEMKDIVKSFYGVTVLRGVNFGVRPGEVHVLLGENGAGKSTLMKILSGVYKADSGDILIDGKKADVRDPAHSLALGIGMVYQELSLVPEVSVVENIWLGNLPAGKMKFIDWNGAKKRTKQIFDDLGVDIDVNRKTSSYDLGIQQLIEIFRVISKEVKIVILDEPTSSLTDVEVEKLFRTIRKLKKQGISFVYITHKLEEVFEIGDRVTVLRDGSTIGNTIETIEEATEDGLVRMMVGRTIDEQYPKISSVTPEVILEARGLSDGKNFFDASFTLHKGEVLGVACLVGSGRSNLARALFGLRRLTDGEITYRGERYAPKNPSRAIENRFGLITKDRKDGLLLHMPIRTNICISKKEGLVKGGFCLRANEKEEAEKYMRLLNIDANSSSRKVRDLSGGNQQKVAVARWICNGTKLFIMDEPTRGVDVGARVEVYNLINEITGNGGAVLMISSDMPELLGISDNIMVMKRGRVTAMLESGECTQELILEKAAGSEMK